MSSSTTLAKLAASLSDLSACAGIFAGDGPTPPLLEVKYPLRTSFEGRFTADIRSLLDFSQ
jgi:hypothetical protein